MPVGLPAPGTLTFSSANYDVIESDGNATITLKRTGGTDNQVVAKVALTDVTTIPGDYRFTPGARDAAFNAGGELEALPYWSVALGFTHRWSDQFRSTISYGYVNLDTTAGQDATFYESSHYASANLVWQLRKRLSVGLEGLYGIKEARNGVDSGDHWRVQLGMVYSLFD